MLCALRRRMFVSKGIKWDLLLHAGFFCSFPITLEIKVLFPLPRRTRTITRAFQYLASEVTAGLFWCFVPREFIHHYSRIKDGQKAAISASCGIPTGESQAYYLTYLQGILTSLPFSCTPSALHMVQC